ncbi:hypothetical protein [Empedobacter tilapiae]|nr:hypothetical protein [Empedobacter tilapiae]
MLRLILIFFPFFLFGQVKKDEFDVYKKFLERKVHYQLRSELTNMDFKIHESDEYLSNNQEFINKYITYGFSGEVGYMISDYTELSLGLSYYKLFDYNLNYYPVFTRIRFFADEGINTFYISLKTGYNLGNYKGIHLEGALGLRFGAFSLIPLNLNLFLTLNDLDYPDYDKNLKAGLSLGIEL